MSLLILDHLVMACADLDSGSAWLEAKLGCPLAAGGTHSGYGTHNRLLQLGGGTYLELIAPDPKQSNLNRPRLFGLDAGAPALPTLIHFVVSTRSMDQALSGLDYSPGEVVEMTRGTLRWKITVARHLLAGGTLPTVIEWPSKVHPGLSLPFQGVSLTRLVLAGPQGTLNMLRPDLLDDPRLFRIPAKRHWLGMELQTLRGPVFFNSDATTT